MPTRDEAWPDGTPCWVDLQVDDPAKAREFYSALFGWEVQDTPEDAGGYLMAMKGGRPAAGIGPKPSGSSMPSVWSTYIAASDVDAMAPRVTGAGGRLIMEPLDVMDAGRMTVAAATDGSVFGLWQAGQTTGFEVFNEPGTVCWNELHTTDYEGAKKFYAEVFGYTFTEIGGEGFTYSTFALPGSSAESMVGGCSHDTMKPETAPNYWLVWFAVGDCDTATDQAKQLGGSVMMGPETSPFGRMSVLTAPQGEVLGLIDMHTRAEPPG